MCSLQTEIGVQYRSSRRILAWMNYSKRVQRELEIAVSGFAVCVVGLGLSNYRHVKMVFCTVNSHAKFFSSILVAMDSATFQFHDEDHTLGNALRYMLAKKPTVQFAGYCVPHPSESTMNVRVQCESGTQAETVVDEALGDLSEVFSEISSSFRNAVVAHSKRK